MNSTMMQFDGIAAVFAIIALLCLFAGYKLLASSSWIAGWMRGNIGIVCILLTGFFVLCVMDIRSYKPMFDDKTIATLSFREISQHHYEVRIVDVLGIENRYSIAGDTWYLNANQFKWSKRLSLGLGHGYRLNTIVGEYKNSAGSETRDVIFRSRYLDVWQCINSYAPSNFLVSTAVVLTAAQPLTDAAMYEVVPSGVDLIVKPLNEFAKRAQQATIPIETHMEVTVEPSTAIKPDAAPSTAVVSVSVPSVVINPDAAAPAVQDKHMITP